MKEHEHDTQEPTQHPEPTQSSETAERPGSSIVHQDDADASGATVGRRARIESSAAGAEDGAGRVAGGEVARQGEFTDIGVTEPRPAAPADAPLAYESVRHDPASSAALAQTLARARSSTWKVIARHNPFFLLSAACMLAGCIAVANTTTWSPIETLRIVALIGTLEVYQFLLMGLGLVLLIARNNRRDGVMLLALATVFMADVNYLNAELVTSDLATGLLVSGGLLAAALGKMGLIIRLTRMSVTWGQVLFFATQWMVLFAMPAVLAWHQEDRGVVPLHLYACWWIIALLPAGYQLLRPASSHAWPSTAVWLFWVIPWLSCVMHLGILHYVHDIAYVGAMATPMLLLIALGLSTIQRDRSGDRLRQARTIQGVLLVVAVLVSVNAPRQLELTLGSLGLSQVSLSPFEMAVGTAYLTGVWIFARPLSVVLIGAGLAALLMVWFGPSRQQMANALQQSWAFVAGLINAVRPQSRDQWGIIAIVTAFVLLLIGGWVSLRKRPDTPVSARPL